MSHLTPIGLRLSASLSDEHLRMQNEWFFKWHAIGGQQPVMIESFNGKPICYGGIKFSGSAHSVYWDTIQRYLRKKIGLIFDGLEEELKKYSLEVRQRALTEAQSIVGQFVARIRRTAIEKDRILRGNGIEFPPEHDMGQWRGCQTEDIEARVEGLRRIYCDLQLNVGGADMSLQSLMKDKVTLVKKDGTVLKMDIPAAVTSGQITTFVTEFPIEVGDHLLRQLPNGLVEDFVVSDPGYHSGIAGAIPPTYQVKVRRSDAPAASPQTIIANFHGPNSRMNVNSTDNSVNIVSDVSGEQLTGLINQIRASLAALPQEQQAAIAEPIAVLEIEAASSVPSQSKIRTALQTIKTVAEGATGNLIASGIGVLIAKMLGIG
ncbi:hypothetical protein [Bradyrhizobium sp. CCGUVB14]|uniref:hypothetical protein n=1 Tax=Bradyrhizobium sp. CCGUVB14 TaxID=2949628 RepID=UPI0020B3B8BC|nr:hypothetical protein [Bradyrhizobium sp. CCGUVB14]MCP3441999.1 hypothetical protein [Bradyrhizobium sp. CCGUVB14]